eukprot:TCONS_00029423-protein
MDVNEHDWKLDPRLVKYLEKHIRNYIPDKELEKDILEETPVPSNVSPELKMDSLFDCLLREKGSMGTKTLAVDKSISRISNKVRDILAPLAKIWQSVERARSGDENEKLDLEEVATHFQQSILLLGQALNASNFFRRKNALMGLGIRESYISVWLRETLLEELQESDGKLFGEETIKSLTKQAKVNNQSLKQFLFSRRVQTANRTPFSWSSSRSTSHGEGHEQYTDEQQAGLHHRIQNRRGKGKKNSVKLHRTSPQSSKTSADKRGVTKIWENTPKYKEPHRGFIKSPVDTDWKDRIFSKQLVKTDSGQIHLGNSFRLSDPNNREADSKNKTTTNKFKFQNESLDKSRDKNLTGERGCEESSKHRRSIFVHSIFKREKGTRKIQASYKSKGTELIHSISKIQNGNFEGCEKHPPEGGLHGQNRPEGRLFCNTVASPIKEVCEIQLGRKPIRIPMPDVRIGTS